MSQDPTDPTNNDIELENVQPDAAEEEEIESTVAEAEGVESEDPQDVEAEKKPPALSIVPVEPLDDEHIRCVIEAALLAADDALTIDRLFKLFVPGELAEEGAKAQVRDAIEALTAACEGRGFELKKVASGYRMQVRQSLSPWVSRLWEEKPPRYTRALLETMALIAYKQPATRGDIEEVRGVTVSSNIMRTLLERGWIREVGHRDVPGRPSMYGTTKEFLDYFNLSSLDELPSLPEIRELVEPAATKPDDVLDAPEESRSDATKALLEQGEDGPPDAEQDADETQTDEAETDEVQTDDTNETLVGVPAVEGADAPESTPVFAHDEVLVVSTSADSEVQADVQTNSDLNSELTDLDAPSSAEIKD